jgi:predicted RNA binding protein YcfA (HicA-like mRNA interferase family)
MVMALETEALHKHRTQRIRQLIDAESKLGKNGFEDFDQRSHAQYTAHGSCRAPIPMKPLACVFARWLRH